MNDDRALIQAVIAGDRDAAVAFVLQYSALVASVLHRSGLPKSLIDDAHNQVFLKLWDDDFRRLRAWAQHGSFASYLAPIARHTGIDLVRVSPGGRQPDGEMRIPSDDPSPERIAEMAAQREKLSRAVTLLGDRDRQLYALRYVEECSGRQIAARLDMTENAVYVALHRLEKKLERLIRHDPDAPGDDTGPPARPGAPGPVR